MLSQDIEPCLLPENLWFLNSLTDVIKNNFVCQTNIVSYFHYSNMLQVIAVLFIYFFYKFIEIMNVNELRGKDN